MKRGRLTCPRASRAPAYRVAVHRRRAHSLFDGIDIAMSGRRWSWSCTCGGVEQHATTQPLALRTGLAHLAVEHGERPRHRRR